MKSKKTQCAITFSPSMMSVSAQNVYIYAAVAELIIQLSSQLELPTFEVRNHVYSYLQRTSDDELFAHLQNDKKYLLTSIKEEQEHFIKKEF